MDIEERIEIRADLIYTGILDAVERLKNQSVDVFMEKVRDVDNATRNVDTDCTFICCQRENS